MFKLHFAETQERVAEKNYVSLKIILIQSRKPKQP